MGLYRPIYLPFMCVFLEKNTLLIYKSFYLFFFSLYMQSFFILLSPFLHYIIPHTNHYKISLFFSLAPAPICMPHAAVIIREIHLFTLINIQISSHWQLARFQTRINPKARSRLASLIAQEKRDRPAQREGIQTRRARPVGFASRRSSKSIDRSIDRPLGSRVAECKSYYFTRDGR